MKEKSNCRSFNPIQKNINRFRFCICFGYQKKNSNTPGERKAKEQLKSDKKNKTRISGSPSPIFDFFNFCNKKQLKSRTRLRLSNYKDKKQERIVPSPAYLSLLS